MEPRPSPYSHPSQVVSDPPPRERYRDPAGVTRFLQGFLALCAVLFALSAPTYLRLLSNTHGFLPSPFDRLVLNHYFASALWSAVLVLTLALGTWLWRIHTNLLALGSKPMPPVWLPVLGGLALLSLGVVAQLAEPTPLHLTEVLAAVCGAGYLAYYLASAARHTRRRSATGYPLAFRAWALVVAAQVAIPALLIHRASTHPFDTTPYVAYASASIPGLVALAYVALAWLAGTLAAQQQACRQMQGTPG